MKTHHGLDHFKNSAGTIVTIGTFDGVHIGHQKIIKRLLERAQSEKLEAVVLTFFPHPRMVLQQDDTIKLINTIEERSALLAKLGLHHLIIHPFTKDFSRMDAAHYVEEVLVNTLNAKKVIIGYDHRFGRNRSASIDDLKLYGTQFGFAVEEIGKQELDDVAISSTKIRRALEEGAVQMANAYLGRSTSLNGVVIEGKKLGRTLGFPTANLKIDAGYKLIPAQGVYIVSAQIDHKTVYGMMNIGINPTLNGTQESIETHFFDFNQDLYGRELEIQLLKRLRDERRFNSIEALKEALQQNEYQARHYIKEL